MEGEGVPIEARALRAINTNTDVPHQATSASRREQSVLLPFMMFPAKRACTLPPPSTIKEKFPPGTFIWAKMDRKLWPAIVISSNDINVHPPSPFYSWVFWFGDHRVSKIKDTLIEDFVTNFETVYSENCSCIEWRKCTLEAIREFGLPETSEITDQQLVEWAYSKLQQSRHKPGLTAFVKEKLEILIDEKDIIYLSCKMGVDYDARENISNYKKGIVPKLMRCLGCYSFLLADEHPIFHGYFCMDCKDNYQNTFDDMEEGVKIRCTICGCKGDMVYCQSNSCSFVYCSTCIKDFCEPGAFLIIQKETGWLCFTCDDNINIKGLLSVKPTWRSHLKFLLTNPKGLGIPMAPVSKKPMRILSIYDGISGGLLSILKQNIIHKYFSCEIDEDCIKIVKKHHSSQVTFLGDIFKLTEDDIKSIVPIDFILVGNPNVDLLKIHKTSEHDVSYMELVFLEFFRVMRILQLYNGRKFFWLFNSQPTVTTLQNKSMITRFLLCEPKLLHTSTSFWKYSSLLWSNLPSFHVTYNSLEEFRREMRKSFNSYIQEEDMTTPTNIQEIETTLGFPKDYTEVSGISKDNRLKILKRESSVAFLPSYIECLKNYFETL